MLGKHSQAPVWQKRFYDFNVWSERKRVEKLRYMHCNPVKRGLVAKPDQWKWSSFRSYMYGERGLVRVNFQEWPLAGGPAFRVFCEGWGSLTHTTNLRMYPKCLSSLCRPP